MKKRLKEESFGEKMKKLRRQKGLSYDYLANETGYTKEYLSQIENQGIMPPVSVIIQVSKALSVDAGDFLSAEERVASEKRRIESYVKRTEAYSYKTLTPGAKTKHMKAFLVTIDPKEDHKMVEYHHEGEEFIYVLEGRLEITVGENVNVLKRGQTIHFNSALTHKLKNLSEKKTELIVVVYTP